MYDKDEDFDVCPVLLAQPEQDRWTPFRLSKPFLERIVKAKVKTVILPNGGTLSGGATQPASAMKSGYTFAGFMSSAWTGTKSLGDIFSMPANDVAVTVVWEANYSYYARKQGWYRDRRYFTSVRNNA